MNEPLRLHFDTSLVSSALADLPVIETLVGTRPTLSTGDLLVALAPVYLEAGAMARALVTSMKIPTVPRFASPLPWPIIDPHPDLVGLSLSSSSSDSHLTVCFSLATGLLCPVVPDEPVIFVTLNANGQMIDPLPFDSDASPMPSSTGGQADSTLDKIEPSTQPGSEADRDEPEPLS